MHYPHHYTATAVDVRLSLLSQHRGDLGGSAGGIKVSGGMRERAEAILVKYSDIMPKVNTIFGRRGREFAPAARCKE